MIKLSPRLQALADLLPEHCSCLYDIGCDHAQLPIAMIQGGRCQRAVAVDIREGPLARAAANCRREGMGPELSLLLNDGLKGVFVQATDTVLIAGLGGHEIAEILEGIEAPPGLEVFVQVNWHWWILRQRAVARGYHLAREWIIAEGDRLYLVINYVYTGESAELSALSAYVGPVLLERYRAGKPSQQEALWLRRLRAIAEKRARSGRSEDLDTLTYLEGLQEGIDVSKSI